MTLTPFKGRCHTCGHDHDAEDERLRDLMSISDAGLRERDRHQREVEALRADAERYRWLAAHCRSTAEHWGGRWSIIVDGPAPVQHDEEDAFDAAIDAARAALQAAQEPNAKLSGQGGAYDA